MKSVYETANGAEARMVAGVLEQAGLDPQVWGEHVGAYADPLGSVRVAVPVEQESEARRVLADWEGPDQKQPDEAVEDSHAHRPEDSSRSPLRPVTLVAAGIALVVVIWSFARLL